MGRCETPILGGRGISISMALCFLYTVDIILKIGVRPMLVNKAYKFRIYPNKK